MTLDGQLIGQNMFMKAVIAADDGRSIPIMTMGRSVLHRSLKGRGMERFYWIILWKKQKSLDAEQYALKEILIFMKKADLNRQAKRKQRHLIESSRCLLYTSPSPRD